MAAAPPSDRSGRAVWALLLASSVLYFFSSNEADNDLWGHVFFGRAILAARSIPRVDTYAYTSVGHAWVNHEWLSQVVLALAYEWAGAPALLLLKLVVAAATFVLLCGLIRRRTATPQVWGLVGLLSIAVLARGFAIRPQIFTYFGIALTLWLLDSSRDRRRSIVVLPALFVIWANLHGGFVLGLAIVGLFAAASVLHDAGPRREPWIVFIACAAGTVLNPYGARLYAFVWNELSRTHPITEWQAATPSDAGQLAFFGMLALVVVTAPLVRRWREDGWQLVLALAIGVLAVRHQRHTPVFALCAAAPLAAQLERARGWFTQRSSFALSPGPRRFIAIAIGALALVQIALTAARWQRDGLQLVFDPGEYPTAAVRAIGRAGVHVNLAVPLDWGEYVLWFLAPQVQVSLDGRFATLFSEQLVADNFNFFSGAPGWRRLVDEYPTDAALVPAGAPCPIAREPGWQRVYADAVAVLYVRTDRDELIHINAAPVQPAPGIFP